MTGLELGALGIALTERKEARMHVIESDDYREEVETLKADPIIQALARELPPGFQGFDKWDFTVAAGDEYRNRGGENARTIGGPARAIRALVVESRSVKVVDRIIAYEAGELDHDEMVELFQELVNTGLAWKLQGHYGRTAHALIEAGVVTPA